MFQDEPPADQAERTIALSRKDILAARRLLHLLMGAEQASSNDLQLEPRTTQDVDVDRATLVARAREEFHHRRRRANLFGQSMFGEPAWDMLLALYVLDVSGQRQTFGNLVQIAAIPMATAKRWLDFLEGHDLIRRDPHPTDRRTAFVSLTAKARDKLDAYYSETIETTL